VNHRAAATSLLIVVAGVAAAFTAGVVAEQAMGLGRLAVAAIVVAVIGVVFAIRLPEGLASFGIAALLGESLNHWTGLDIRYLDEVGLPMLAAVALVMHRRRLSIPSPGVTELGLIAFIVAGVASSLLNDVPAFIWIPGLVLVGKGVAFFYVVRWLDLDLGEIRRLGGSVLIIGLAITLIGLVQFVNPTWAEQALGLPPTGQARGSINVVGSVFTHPAVYGWLTAFISLFLYARFAVLRDRIALLLALVANLGTLLSGRRSPLIGVLVGLLVGAARQVTAGRRLGRAWAIVGAAVLLVIAASVPILGDFYGATLERYGARPQVIAEIFAEEPDARVVAELQPRVALYAGSVAIARDEAPLGAGIGRFGSHMSRESYSPLYRSYGLHRTYGLREANPRAVTDTFWPMILGETGVVGLLGALVFVGGLGVRLWRAAASDAVPEVRAFTLGALLVFSEALVRSLVSPVLVAPPIAYFVFGAVALALAVEDQHAHHDPEQVK
jgi:hypothetical protein